MDSARAIVTPIRNSPMPEVEKLCPAPAAPLPLDLPPSFAGLEEIPLSKKQGFLHAEFRAESAIKHSAQKCGEYGGWCSSLMGAKGIGKLFTSLICEARVQSVLHFFIRSNCDAARNEITGCQSYYPTEYGICSTMRPRVHPVLYPVAPC